MLQNPEHSFWKNRLICILILPLNTAVFAPAKETEIRNTHVRTVFQIRRKQIEQECLSWAVYPSDADQKNFVRLELWYNFSNSLSVQFRLRNPLIVCKLWNVGYLYRIVDVYISWWLVINSKYLELFWHRKKEKTTVWLSLCVSQSPKSLMHVIIVTVWLSWSCSAII